jgi:cytochrome P450 PksS
MVGKRRFDLMTDFALPLPVTVISELLGVPEADRARFARWSHSLLTAPVGSWRIPFSLPDMLRFVRYLRKLVVMKRAAPRDDLVSALVTIEADGERLSGDELLAMMLRGLKQLPVRGSARSRGDPAPTGCESPPKV